MNKNTISILSLPFEPLTAHAAEARLRTLLRTPKTSLVFTPNTVMLFRAERDHAIARMLASADLLLPDGMGVVAASRFLGTPLPERLSGIDMAQKLLAHAEKQGLRVFLLGGKPGIAKKAAERLKQRFPDLRICGTHHGYFGHHREEEESVVQLIRAASPHILFACLGFPKQEEWLLRHRTCFPTLRLGMGLGGSLDVWSGEIERAPERMQSIGLEWLWRALREPRRFSVLLTVPALAAALLKQKKG